MKSQANQDIQPRTGQFGPNSQNPPGGQEGNQGQGGGERGEGGGQPKPGVDRGGTEVPDIPQEIPAREIERKPSDPQSVPNGPEQGPKKQMPDKDHDSKDKSPDVVGQKGKEDSDLVDKRDRFPFPNK